MMYVRTFEQAHSLLSGSGYVRIWSTSDGKASLYRKGQYERSVIYCKDKGYRIMDKLVKS